MELDEKCEKSSLLKISRILQSAPNAANLTQTIRHEKYSTYAIASKFSSVSLYDQPFQDIAYFRIFLIDSHVKITKCRNVLKPSLNTKKTKSLYSSMVANVLIKFGSEK